MNNDNELTRLIIGHAIGVHRALGPGLLEGAYAAALVHALRRQGIACEREVPMPSWFRGMRVEVAFRADLIVERSILVELKALDHVLPVHKRQLLTYLRLSNLRVGLLLNFGGQTMREGIVRVVNGLAET